MKVKIYKKVSHFFQNLMITLYNIKAYRIRYSGAYEKYRELFFKNGKLSLKQLEDIQKEKYKKFILNSVTHSKYYEKLYKDIKEPEQINNIHKLPIVSKEDLRTNIDEVIIKTTQYLEKSKTGGTTGKSLEIKYTAENLQERFALLDDFRARFGYKLGRKTAWFSGKTLLTQKDIERNRFWKMDYYHLVRYYSTFHIKADYLEYYVKDLIKYQPEYFVGFPSTILEIAKYGMKNGYNFPENTVKAIFPTAETITKEMRETIEAFFKTKMYNQYASSEGAPFIFECEKGNLHLELQSGVFEVLDESNQPTKSGRLVVTSFTTEATPLIRYDIGDRITLEDDDKKCTCGNHNPLVKEILGRIDDYIYSPQTGKINLGNVSNTLKDTKGIIRFQVVQDDLNKLDLFVIKDVKVYSDSIEKKFINNWRDRIGPKMELTIHYVDDIPVEKSGKFRIVKNNIKHLVS